MKQAIIFPGQGSQSLGMLGDLAADFPIVNETFTQASDILGFDLWQLTQTDAEALNQTQHTQPAMLVAGYVVYQVLSQETGLAPICMAGHSLGEYTALVAAGALDFSDGVQLVQKRAMLMQSAVPKGLGAMAAILGLDDETVIKLCADYSGEGIVEAVNFNAPGQVVVAGHQSAVESICVVMKKAGAKRAVALPVSVPSHCSLMCDAAAEFKQAIDGINFNIGNVEVLHNVDASKADHVSDMKNKLVAQLYKPVLWTSTVQNMATMGVVQLIESGHGKVLTGLGKRIDKTLRFLPVFDTKSLYAVQEDK